MRSTVAALALPLLVLAGCSAATDTAAGPAAATPATTAAAPATGEFGAPIVTEEPRADQSAPTTDEWIINTDATEAEAGLISILSSTRGPSSATPEAARDIAYYVCSWLRYDPQQDAGDVVSMVYVSAEAFDATRIGLAAQGYCLDTYE